MCVSEPVLQQTDAGCVPVLAGHGREAREVYPELHAQVSADRAGCSPHHISVFGGHSEVYGCYG